MVRLIGGRDLLLGAPLLGPTVRPKHRTTPEGAALAKTDLAELRSLGLGLDASTPLWYYILKEAQIVEGGVRLGPVGARIVGEVIIGLLQLDHRSFLSMPQWRPTLPTRSGQVTGDFRMIDFLTFAGVDPTSRGQ